MHWNLGFTLINECVIIKSNDCCNQLLFDWQKNSTSFDWACFKFCIAPYDLVYVPYNTGCLAILQFIHQGFKKCFSSIFFEFLYIENIYGMNLSVNLSKDAPSVDRNINTIVSWWIPFWKYVTFMSFINGMSPIIAFIAFKRFKV